MAQIKIITSSKEGFEEKNKTSPSILSSILSVATGLKYIMPTFITPFSEAHILVTTMMTIIVRKTNFTNHTRFANNGVGGHTIIRWSTIIFGNKVPPFSTVQKSLA
jgi:hypothetical protein